MCTRVTAEGPPILPPPRYLRGMTPLPGPHRSSALMGLAMLTTLGAVLGVCLLVDGGAAIVTAVAAVVSALSAAAVARRQAQ